MNDKYILVVFIAGTFILLVFAVMMVVFLVIHKQRQNHSKLERQQLEFSYNSALLNSKIEVQEQALSFVSQEIHDNIGQVLSFSCMQLANLKSAVIDEDNREILNENLDRIRHSIKELRLLSHSLNSALVEKRDLEEAIESELSRVRAFSTIYCDLIINGEGELSPEHRLLCFRIFQEALQNVVKHSEAKNVTIIISYLPELLELCIQDDGKGMDTNLLGESATMGMINMQQRASLLNGNLHLSSSPQNGTSIVLTIPQNKS
ncbi:MAG: ATP-binding protein [Chitinophagaceae bacterium]